MNGQEKAGGRQRSQERTLQKVPGQTDLPPPVFIPLSARSCRAEVGEGAALPAALGAWSVPAAPRATGSVR